MKQNKLSFSMDICSCAAEYLGVKVQTNIHQAAVVERADNSISADNSLSGG